MIGPSVDAYRQVHVTTASPGSLVLQLLDGAIRFVRQATRALDRDDIAGFARAESRAHAIVAELRQALDHEIGGEVARNLDRLYDFILRHLSAGLAQRDRGHLAAVDGLLSTIRDGFAGAIDAPGAGTRPPP